MKNLVLVIMSLGIGTASYAQENQTTETEAFFKKIHGAWEVQSKVQDGETKDKDNSSTSLILNFADPYTLIMANQRCVLNLDPSKNPVEFRFAPLPEKPSSKRLIISGIMKIENEKLVIAMAAKASTAPPKKFESPKGSKVILMTLTRPKLPEISNTEDLD